MRTGPSCSTWIWVILIVVSVVKLEDCTFMQDGPLKVKAGSMSTVLGFTEKLDLEGLRLGSDLAEFMILFINRGSAIPSRVAFRRIRIRRWIDPARQLGGILALSCGGVFHDS